MTQTTRSRGARALAAASAVACAALLVAAPDFAAAAKKRSERRIARNLVVQVSTPLGLQGAAGAGDRTVLPFTLYDRSGRRVDVEVEYGIDRDGDGVVADGSQEGRPSEFRTATHQRRDPRDTSRVKVKSNGKRSTTYRPGRAGATHAFVWGNLADLGRARHVAGAQIVRDEHGRVVPDPFDRTQPLFGDAEPGVVLRIRAIRRGGKRERTDWVYTQPFSVDSSAAPSARVDGVADVDVDAGLVAIDWTAFDDDSEDLNGNGALDVLDLEDRDGDGRLHTAPVAVAFDHHLLADGEPVPASTAVLEGLRWLPCTRADGLGDPDVGVPTAPAGVGRAATFVWDFHADVGGVELAAGRYLIRAVPYDELGNVGAPAYLEGVVEIASDTR